MRVNPQTVRDLGEAVGRDALADIAAALAETMADLIRALPTLDDAAVTARAHSLKGSTSYLGTEDLYAQAVAADHACKQKQAAEARRLLQAMADAWPATWTELASVLRG
jgi:HPt (histidine-containing phosphotransfer) domain-containing protein